MFNDVIFLEMELVENHITYEGNKVLGPLEPLERSCASLH